MLHGELIHGEIWPKRRSGVKRLSLFRIALSCLEYRLAAREITPSHGRPRSRAGRAGQEPHREKQRTLANGFSLASRRPGSTRKASSRTARSRHPAIHLLPRFRERGRPPGAPAASRRGAEHCDDGLARRSAHEAWAREIGRREVDGSGRVKGYATQLRPGQSAAAISHCESAWAQGPRIRPCTIRGRRTPCINSTPP